MNIFEKISEAAEKELTDLNLKGIGLTVLPSSIGQLTHLQVLDLWKNQITSLPPEIGQIRNLQKLNLGGNQLIDLPQEIGCLTNLHKMDLRGNKLTSLPPEIGQLVNLKALDLGENQLTVIPPEIGRLTKLECLNLVGNRLTSLPPEIGRLTNLKELYLGGNQLTSLPPEISQLTDLHLLYLTGNPIQTPPIEIIERGYKAIFEYLDALKKSRVKKLYEAKLILVGQGGVGKTCLANKLMNIDWDIDKNDTSTAGIAIRSFTFPYDAGEFKVNLWDFGGQEIYHATHQFFLTKRSLYLYVWDARREEDISSGFYYWLNIVKLLSNNSPVIVVLNKIDERIKPINQTIYQEKFDAIKSFEKVSCKDGRGIKDLTELIKNEIIKLPHIGNEWPLIWTEIRGQLEKDPRDYVEYKDYLKICRDYDLNEREANRLSEFLHDLGVILHFQDDKLLQDIVILKPEWGTKAVYRVLDTKKIIENHGRFHLKDLDGIWHDSIYPRDKHYMLLQLMMKFELCFKLEDADEYIVPELLSPEKPRFSWNEEDNLKFVYLYDFIPAGIVTRFIVRQHRRIEDNYYWKDGVILNYENTRALIESDPMQRKTKILIEGFDKKGLLAIIRGELEYIHRTLNNPDVKEMLPCICPQCIDTKEPFLFNYKTLKRFMTKKKPTIACEKSAEDVAISQLLNGIEKRKSEFEYDFFISHASEDKEKVARPLAEALSDKGHRVWFDELSLTLGDRLLRSIDKGLSKSRFGIVVLSRAFIAKEWPQAELDGLTSMELNKKRKVVLPIMHEITYEDILDYSPVLAGKVAVSTAKGMDYVVGEIVKVLQVADE